MPSTRHQSTPIAGKSLAIHKHKPHKTQKSPTKSLKAMTSKAINSRVSSKPALGTSGAGGGSQPSRPLGTGKQPAAFPTSARCPPRSQQGQRATRK